MLQDSGSKFGTLTLSRGHIEVLPDTHIGMQIGRTLVIFQVQTDDDSHQFKVGQYLTEREKQGQREYKAAREKNKEARKQRLENERRLRHL